MRVPRSYLKSIRKASSSGEPTGDNLHPEEHSRNVTYYSICCREDKMLLVDFPSFSGGLYMPAGSSLCSSIPGTFIEHEQVNSNAHARKQGRSSLNYSDFNETQIISIS